MSINVQEARQIKKTSYFQGVKSELKKVSWTSRKELVTYTKIVVGATFLMGMGIYFSDLVIKTAIDGLGVIARWIFG